MRVRMWSSVGVVGALFAAAWAVVTTARSGFDLTIATAVLAAGTVGAVALATTAVSLMVASRRNPPHAAAWPAETRMPERPSVSLSTR